ncbi:hypothetical protein MTO96_033991 [Rhipicephalus appendiculatus]
MEIMHKWFSCMDVSNLQQHIHCNDENARHFHDIDDARHLWLEGDCLAYIEDLKNQSTAQNFWSKETYHALILSTKSNEQCIRYLLTEEHFKFVLTRKFSSDPIESLFGFLRRSSGCNDALDVKSDVSGLEKMVKTGIIASSSESNVRSTSTFASREFLLLHQSPSSSSSAEAILTMSVQTLKEHCLSEAPRVPNPDTASVAMVGGFIVRAATENIPCADCVSLLQGPKANKPLQGLIAHEDHGGLLYPTQELVRVLLGFSKFVQCALPHRSSIHKPLEVFVERSVNLLMGLPVLNCGNKNSDHRRRLLELITKEIYQATSDQLRTGKY